MLLLDLQKRLQLCCCELGGCRGQLLLLLLLLRWLLCNALPLHELLLQLVLHVLLQVITEKRCPAGWAGQLEQLPILGWQGLLFAGGIQTRSTQITVERIRDRCFENASGCPKPSQHAWLVKSVCGPLCRANASPHQADSTEITPGMNPCMSGSAATAISRSYLHQCCCCCCACLGLQRLLLLRIRLLLPTPPVCEAAPVAPTPQHSNTTGVDVQVCLGQVADR